METYKNIIASPCYVYGVSLNGDGSSTPLIAGEPGQRPVWIHLDYANEDCANVLKQMDVSESSIESLIRHDTRPRTMLKRGGTIIILRAVNLNLGNDPEDMVSLRFLLESNRLITLRKRNVKSTLHIKHELELGQGPDNIHALMLAIIENIADLISDYVNQLEAEIEIHETNIEVGSATVIRRKVIDIRRQAVAIRRYLAPQRDALDIFYLQAKNFLAEEDALYLHEQSDRIIRNVEDLDLLREKALLLQEELQNRFAQDQAARMYVLAMVSTIFMPVTFLTGVFGMNVAGLPGLIEPRAFNLVIGFMLVVVCGIVFWLNKKKWL